MENYKIPRNLRSKVLFLIVCIIMPLLLFGCAGGKSVENNAISQRWEKGTVQHDSVAFDKERVRTMGTYAHDSIYNHDSVVVVIRNDTVLRDRWHFRTREKTKVMCFTDTLVLEKNIYHYKTDTLKYYVNRIKYKEVDKKLTWWQDAKMKIGGFSIFLCIIFAIMYGIERVRRKNANY